MDSALFGMNRVPFTGRARPSRLFRVGRGGTLLLDAMGGDANGTQASWLRCAGGAKATAVWGRTAPDVDQGDGGYESQSRRGGSMRAVAVGLFYR